MVHETIKMEESIDEMIPEVCGACYVFRSVCPVTHTQCVSFICTSSDMYNNCGGFTSYSENVFTL